MEKEGGNSFGGDGFLGRAKNHPLSKPMVYHDQERVKARGNGEICWKGREAMDLMGDKGGTVGCVLTLFCWQRAQPSTYRQMKEASPGHQNSVATS